MNCISAQTAPKSPNISAACAVSPPRKFSTSFGNTGIMMPSASTSSTTVTKMNATAAGRGGRIEFGVDSVMEGFKENYLSETYCSLRRSVAYFGLASAELNFTNFCQSIEPLSSQKSLANCFVNLFTIWAYDFIKSSFLSLALCPRGSITSK